MKHLLGLGVLVLTVASGYAISGFAGVPGPRPVESALVTGVDIDAFIATAAARYGVSEELIAAIIEAGSIDGAIDELSRVRRRLQHHHPLRRRDASSRAL